MNEVDHQTNIKKSVILQGGYSFKLSNRFTIGIPDLLVMLPPFVPCLAEVKDLGECVPDFDRKLDVSPKQNLELVKMNAAYVYKDPKFTMMRVGFLLIIAKWQLMNIIVPLPQGTERLAASSLVEGVTFWKRIRGVDGGNPTYPMSSILNKVGVPRL